MAIGWDEIGDLSEYGKKTDIKNKMIEVYGVKDGSKAYMNYVQCTWDFVKGMNIGDVVFVKQGLYKVLGYGIVTSDYYFDDNGKYVCLEQDECPTNYKLINSTNKCIKECKNDDMFGAIYEYNGGCYTKEKCTK